MNHLTRIEAIKLIQEIIELNVDAGLASKLLSLGTIGLDGSPKVRTMVYRGFTSDSQDLMLSTDARSAKINEIQADPRMSVAWYFPITWQQLRMEGVARITTSDADPEAMRCFQLLSPKTRASFAAPYPSISPLDAFSSEDPPFDLDLALCNFRLLSFRIRQMTLVNLKEPQSTIQYHLE